MSDFALTNMVDINTLLVLAGGEGTRLKEVTGNISKPLVKIAGTHVITFILKKLALELSVSNINLLIQKKHEDQYTKYLKNESKVKDLNINLFIEDKKLGTGGAIKNFLKNNDLIHFYVTNADTLIKTNISKFKNAPQNSILCTPLHKDKRFSAVKIDKDNKVIKFGDERSGQKIIANTGIYKFHRSIFDHVGEDTFDLEKSLFPVCAESALINCFLMKINFEDIGIPEAYYREVKKKGSRATVAK